MTRAVTLAEIADTNTFVVDGTNVRVGINSSIPTTTLDVGGAVKATSFTGDGSSLTGVASTDNIITGTAATFTSNVNISGITTVGVLTAYTSVTVGAAITADAASGIVTATTFSGALTGNVTGNASGTAGGLTGTPDIAVRNITGVAATFTGVLTYEDVTNIDSIGIITARSNVSIADSIIHTGDTDTSIRFPAAGTFTVSTNGSEAIRVDSSQRLLVGKTSSTNSNIAGIGYDNLVQIEGAGVGEGLQVSNDVETARINLIWKETEANLSDGDKLGHLSFGAGVTNAVERARIECNAQTTNANGRGGQLTFMTCADGDYIPYERLRIDNSGAAIFKGGLAEKYENAGTTLGSQPNNPLSDGNVILFTGNESGNKTINFTGVHATLSNGETVSFTAILTPNNSGKITVVQVDGQAITVKWSGGSAPSAGASGQDIYTFQILKTGTGTSDYTVFGAAANYA